MNPKSKINIYIVDEDKQVTQGVEKELIHRLGNSINITKFSSGENCIAKIDENTTFVVLAYYFSNSNGNKFLEAIKSINPNTQVVMLSANDDLKTAVDAFRFGATDFVIKGEKGYKKVSSIIYNIITYPIQILVKEFKVTKYIALFIVTIFIMAILVLFLS